MFINDVHKKEEIRNIAIQDLKKLGIKYRSKKHRQNVQEAKAKKVFKTALHLLRSETVTLPSGQQLVVPKIVHELCSYVLNKHETEGLFRKGGSKSRQNEIRLSLDAGCYLGEEHHEIDVASVLKTFFRELPEPLIPYSFHELFLRCMSLNERQTEAVLLACLLLPTEHLNTLAYFMQFLCRVSEWSKFNKMDSMNLAIVIGPTLLPTEEKLPNIPAHRLNKTCELFKLLIDKAEQIGVLSERIIERIAMTCSTNSLNCEEETGATKKKKKRRSGSLTRMLSGLKRIVSNKSEEDYNAPMPDLLSTPCLTHSAKKRKIDVIGLSSKKRREVLKNMPQNAILNTPFTSAGTPVNCHPNVQRISPMRCEKIKSEKASDKLISWTCQTKAKNHNNDTVSVKSLRGVSLPRRWSAVSAAAGLKRKKSRNSCSGLITTVPCNKIAEKDPQIDNRINDLSEEIIKQKQEPTEPDNYVRISKVEYEEIKNRMSEIERRISIEMENVEEAEDVNNIEEVEKAYEQTLVQVEALSPTTDHLAKRLSRDLKIRQSDENKVFRSPSARKIGSIRRRSREKIRLSRNQSWCITSVTPAIKHGKTNSDDQASDDLTRSSSTSVISSASSASWKSGQGFFNTPEMPVPNMENCRASLAKLRSQNAGMVLAKARLFDNMMDDDESAKTAQMMGRVRTLRVEERRVGKKSMSPRKRNGRSQRMQKCDGSRQERETTSPKCTTPRNVPHIKKSLNPKSPRRVCRTPVAEFRQTPLKVTHMKF